MKVKIELIEPDFYRIHLTATPEKNKANKELLKLLAKTLQISEKNIKIISGLSSKLKLIQIKP